MSRAELDGGRRGVLGAAVRAAQISAVAAAFQHEKFIFYNSPHVALRVYQPLRLELLGDAAQKLLPRQGILRAAHGEGEHPHGEFELQIERARELGKPFAAARRKVHQNPDIVRAQAVRYAALPLYRLLAEELLRVGLQNICAVANLLGIAVNPDDRRQTVVAEHREVVALARAGITRHV